MLQAVRPELADKDEHEDQTGLESLMEGDQKHHTQLPGATTDGTSACVSYMHSSFYIGLWVGLKDSSWSYNSACIALVQ